jgi:hypothetical protein
MAVKESDFEQLVSSIRQAGQIKRGEMEPTRRFEVKVAAALDPGPKR